MYVPEAGRWRVQAQLSRATRARAANAVQAADFAMMTPWVQSPAQPKLGRTGQGHDPNTPDREADGGQSHLEDLSSSLRPARVT